MNISQVMEVVEASFATRQSIARSLREIDRRALNALVLVKRHGTALAGYGVVAGAFRDGAARLQISADRLQSVMWPLVDAHMRILQLQHYADALAKIPHMKNGGCPALVQARVQWQEAILEATQDAQGCLGKILENVADLQEGISEQQYVVVNGHIEAALSEHVGAPLKRVSRDMETAVSDVRAVVWSYRNILEKLN